MKGFRVVGGSDGGEMRGDHGLDFGGGSRHRCRWRENRFRGGE
jgi:hypothetical protein